MAAKQAFFMLLMGFVFSVYETSAGTLCGALLCDDDEYCCKTGCCSSSSRIRRNIGFGGIWEDVKDSFDSLRSSSSNILKSLGDRAIGAAESYATGLATSAIVGIVVGSVVLLSICIGVPICVYCCMNRSNVQVIQPAAPAPTVTVMDMQQRQPHENQAPPAY